MDSVLETDPGKDCEGEEKIEESFVGDCKDDEEWSEG